MTILVDQTLIVLSPYRTLINYGSSLLSPLTDMPASLELSDFLKQLSLSLSLSISIQNKQRDF
jgi:hypothetical protein